MRWSAELDIRTLKRTLHLEDIRSKSPSMVRKEIWANLLCYNLIRFLMAEAAFAHNLIPRDISFKATMQFFGVSEAISFDVLMEVVVAHLVNDRPLRWEPRAVKKRNSNLYPILATHRRDTRPAFNNM